MPVVCVKGPKPDPVRSNLPTTVVVGAERVTARPAKVSVVPDSGAVVGTETLMSLALGVLSAVTTVA